ncbi:MAG: sensor histidine kinase [Negativicutes bacterium]
MRELCLQYTDLTETDIDLLAKMEAQLPFIAGLTETDIFIDAPASNGVDAIVLAWARPEKHSLYGHSVVGEIAYATREPAVYQTFSTGEMVRNVRGVSQEGVPIAQTVVPLRNDSGRVVGVLIMEKDISAEIRQEAQVEFLSEAADQLSNTLMALSMTGSSWEDWLGNGLFVLNNRGAVTYANRNAARMYRQYCGGEPLGGELMSRLSCRTMEELVGKMSNPMEFEFGSASFLFQAHPLVTYGDLSGCVLSMQDVSELRRKERELNAQSASIREIHHRVKNNLQNVVALLRLQMHRSQSRVVKTEFNACINRILSISQVHDVFAHQNWDFINLKELAGYILQKLVENSALPKQRINTSVQGQSVRIDASQAVPMALVINELVTNSLKHGIKADPYGEISILVEEAGGKIHIVVADSGVELAMDWAQEKKNSMGLYIVRLLICDQLKGTFRLERCGGSTVATVSFPTRDAEGIS